MSRQEAESLAHTVRDAVSAAHVLVRPDDAEWAVEVSTPRGGSFWLRDEDDWEWLRPQIIENSHPSPKSPD
jgi:hypothetical protein